MESVTMSTEPKMDVSFWEKLSDGISAFSEGVSKFFLRLLGSSNERYVQKLGYIRPSKPGAQHVVVPGLLLSQVNALEERMQALTPEQLKDVTPQLRQKLANGATLDDV